MLTAWCDVVIVDFELQYHGAETLFLYLKIFHIFFRRSRYFGYGVYYEIEVIRFRVAFLLLYDDKYDEKLSKIKRRARSNT